LKINFQRVVNSVLTYCLSSGDNPIGSFCSAVRRLEVSPPWAVGYAAGV
jgi:hypothetical protein